MQHHSFDIFVAQHSYHVRVYGSGVHDVLFFHGVNQNSRSFETLLKELNDVTVYCVDMPFHGLTKYTSNEWNPEDVTAFFYAFVDFIGVEKLTISGYSMGAKIALKLVELIPAHYIQSVLIAAPDGIKPQIYYQLATKYALNRKLFSFLMDRPQLVLKISKFLNRLKLLSDSQLKLVNQAMSKEVFIQRVKQIWLGTAPCYLSLEKLISIFSSHQIPIYVLVGRRDAIIATPPVRAFYEQINGARKGFFEFDFGHNFAHPHAMKEISHVLNEKIISQCTSS